VADFKGKKAGFSDYLSALKLIKSGKLLSERNIILLYGKSRWLVQEAVQTIRQTAKKSDYAIAALEPKELTESRITDIFGQSSLFEASTLYIVNKADQAKLLLTKLAKADTSQLSNKIVLVMSADRVPAGLTKSLAGSTFTEVPCFPPWPNEMGKAISSFAAFEGLNIDNGGIQVILETVGNDLQKIKNELVRMSQHLGPIERVLSKDDIAPFLGAMKEDDIYQLDRYLLDKKWPLATSLIFQLVERGEKPLSVLAMLANHCRNVLNVCDGISKGFTPVEIGSRTRLPAFIMKTYLQSARNVRVPAYSKALSTCHQADRIFKSRAIDERLVLGQIVAALAE
jgi:DNA polymerase-3 subunit delta